MANHRPLSFQVRNPICSSASGVREERSFIQSQLFLPFTQMSGIVVKPFVFSAQTIFNDQQQQQQTQVLKIDKLKPSQGYRFTIVAKSRAGVGQTTGSIQFRTLDRQIPEFRIVPVEENKNETCSNDRSCLIRWSIESDGGAPITRAEMLYAKVITTMAIDRHGSWILF
jgi:hypothetical protein